MDGNGHITTVAYDPVQHTFPVLERIHFADGSFTFLCGHVSHGLWQDDRRHRL